MLELLAGEAQFQKEQKYPAERLRFGDDGWRAYYHTHDSPAFRPDEHGHFHLFTRNPDDPAQWAHVAALGMDHQGQPLRWFTVNQWVTGDAWTDADELSEAWACEAGAQAGDNVAQWLQAITGVYLDELAALLVERDRSLAEIADGRELPEVLTDRAVYLLAERPIDLLDRLRIVMEPSVM